MVVEEEGERIEVDLGSDSFLTQSATNLPSTLLAWHYRSRYESLISFSNAAFYSGSLFTIPDRQRVIETQAELCVTDSDQAARTSTRCSRAASVFISWRTAFTRIGEITTKQPTSRSFVRGLLERQTGLSIGVVAFSEAQQSEIEDALSQLAEEDSDVRGAARGRVCA